MFRHNDAVEITDQNSSKYQLLIKGKCMSNEIRGPDYFTVEYMQEMSGEDNLEMPKLYMHKNDSNLFLQLQ